MKLGTIGAVLKFAIQIESTLQTAAELLHSKMTDEKSKTTIAELVAIHKKRINRLRRLQRENTTEMFLEPIVGLSSDQYEDESPVVEKDDALLMQELQEAERRAQSFYMGAAPKIDFLPEIADVFEEFQQEFTDSISPRLLS